jgi:3-hydroxyisobutyrate dehydrogenase-like beta-hydroxyacid dehydrogenase
MGKKVMKKRKIGFIGAGKVGTALATTLFKGGYPVIAVADMNVSASEKLADLVPGCSSLCQQLLCCSIEGSHGSISEF